MKFFCTTELSVPLLQIGLLLMLSTTALLCRRVKLALIINYIFTMYWGYVYNRHLFGSVENLDRFTLFYFGFGLGVVILAVIGFLAYQD